jgi:hypothetical protein
MNNFQAITTDLGEATKYSVQGGKQRKKHSELIREERERLFTNAKPLKINEVARENSPEQLTYKLQRGSLRKYGRKIHKKELKLPDYGRIQHYKYYVVNTPEHNARVDMLINDLTIEFSNEYGVAIEDLKSGNKDYHITRVRNCLLGMLYAHVHMNSIDLARNFPHTDPAQFRERYRQMRYLIQYVYFARPYSHIYKRHKKRLQYDFKNGQQFVNNCGKFGRLRGGNGRREQPC